MSFCFFLFFFTTIIYCYGAIIWLLLRRTHFTEAGHTDTYRKASRNAAITFCIVASVFVACNIQHQVWLLLFNLGYSVNFNSDYWHFVIQMVFLECTVNPFIYLVKSRDFQNALKELLHLRKDSQMTQLETTQTSLTTIS